MSAAQCSDVVFVRAMMTACGSGVSVSFSNVTGLTQCFCRHLSRQDFQAISAHGQHFYVEFHLPEIGAKPGATGTEGNCATARANIYWQTSAGMRGNYNSSASIPNEVRKNKYFQRFQ